MLIAAVVAFAAVVAALAVRTAFALPAPSGPLPVGVTTVGMVRPGDPDTAAGRFDVQIWYPGEQSNDRASYGLSSPGLRRWLYHRLVRTHSAPNVAVAGSQQRWPVLVYVASWGGDRLDNTVLAEDLASHGFVVAALGDIKYDHPPLENLSGPADFSSERAYRATVELGNRKLRYESARASAVLDELRSLDVSDPAKRFTNRLDLQRAGIVGFSFGGAVALATCRRDPRFKAAMNLDGWLFGAGVGYRGGTPYFLATDGAPGPGAHDRAAADPNRRYAAVFTALDERRQLAVLRYGGYSLRLSGAGHDSFTDVPLYALTHRFRFGADPGRFSRTIRVYARAFFERVLDGKDSPLLTPGDEHPPSVTLAAWPFAAAKPSTHRRNHVGIDP